MNASIRPIREEDIDAIVELSLRAWAPVFASLMQVMGPGISSLLYPNWERQQAEAVASVCRDGGIQTWAADAGEGPVGFVSVKLDEAQQRGEIWMLAVDPDFQNRGIGTELTLFAVEWMRECGMKIAIVETGGDVGHAPGRRTYEKAGFTLLPIARYFKNLSEE